MLLRLKFGSVFQAAALMLIAFSLSACVNATGREYSKPLPPQNGSLVYFFRPDSFLAGNHPLRVTVDGKLVGILFNKGYLPHELPAGKHIVGLEDEPGFMGLPAPAYTGLTFTAQERKVHYIMVGVGAVDGVVLMGQSMVQVRIKELSETTAQPYLQSLNLSVQPEPQAE